VSTSYNAKINLDVLFQEVITSGMKSGNVPTRLSEIIDLQPGTDDVQINVAWAKTETGIGSAVTTEYDLIGGLTNTEGTALNFDEVVLIAVRNKSSTAANVLEAGPDATDGFGVLSANKGFWKDASDRSVIPADTWFIVYCKAGVPAAAASTDDFAVITQSGTSSNTWDILVLGRDNP
jgi:rhodanese-related sulfurtransferase